MMFWESSWVFGPGGSFFCGMEGGTNGQSASGALDGCKG